MPPRLFVGDLVFTDSGGLLGSLIGWGTRGRGEEPTKAKHVAIVDDYLRPMAEAVIIEAVAGWGVRRGPMDQWYDFTDQVCVWRPKNLPAFEREAIATHARGRVGQWYPWSKLLLHLVDEKLFKGRNVTRKLQVFDPLVCSGVAGEAYGSRGWTFGGRDPRALTPDDMEDFCRTEPDKFELIVPWGPFPGPISSGR